MKIFKSRKTILKQRGFGLLEVAIGSAIVSVALLTLVNTYGTYVRAALDNEAVIKSAYLIEEGVEAAKLLRDASWATNLAALSADTAYYFSWDGLNWVTTETPQYIDGFFRSFTVSPVFRDANSDIASAGTLDQNTLKLTVSVSWPTRGATTTKVISTYITNLFGN